jgi:hypothetical protein
MNNSFVGVIVSNPVQVTNKYHIINRSLLVTIKNVDVHDILLLTSIDSVLVSVLVSSVLDRGFEPWSYQTKEYIIDIFCSSATHATSSGSKDLLTRIRIMCPSEATC